jgi:hypothetical protein
MKKQLQEGKSLIVIILIVLISIIGISIYNILPKEDSVMKEGILNREIADEVEMMKYQFSGNLGDVSGGDSIGVAKAIFTDGSYNMVATFDDLPDPEGTDFYEGWVVRKGSDFSVISTGKAEVTNGQYVNQYSSDEDLTDHLFYVLTIEPDDGNPEPAGHILEGTMTKI